MQQSGTNLDEAAPRTDVTTRFNPANHLGFSKITAWVFREVVRFGFNSDVVAERSTDPSAAFRAKTQLGVFNSPWPYLLRLRSCDGLCSRTLRINAASFYIAATIGGRCIAVTPDNRWFHTETYSSVA